MAKYLVGGNKALKVLSNISRMKDTTIEAGFFPEQIYASGKSIAEIAVYNEYGTLHIPTRPFFRTAVEKNKSKWKTILKRSLVKNPSDTLSTVGKLGKEIVNDIKVSILTWQYPSNAYSTIKKKGFNKPLVDTGEMANSVTFRRV